MIDRLSDSSHLVRATAIATAARLMLNEAVPRLLAVANEDDLRSEAVLVRRRGAEVSAAVDQLVRRLQGVIVARTYVLMDYDIEAELVDRAVELTPGIESPTISPLHHSGWFAVRAMVPRRDTNRVMDDLWELGARGILVTDIHACRL